MQTQLASIKPKIVSELNTLFDQTERAFSHLNPDTELTISRLKQFSYQGKMLRGSMVVLLAEMLGFQHEEIAVKVGAIVELFQSTLLIHDDIIDQDKLRRGLPSVYAQYELDATTKKYTQPTHFGMSMGICVGDVSLFLAYGLLAQLHIKPTILQDLMTLFSKELLATCLAEMQDTELGCSDQLPSEAAVKSVLLHKTARYTFCLPFLLAATLAEQPATIKQQLDQLGEVLGLLFQIKDDELGLFGDEAQTGKPVGSDVRENKKTLYYVYAMELANDQERQELQTYFGNPRLDSTMLARTREIITSVGAQAKVNAQIINLQQQAVARVQGLPLTTQQVASIQEFITYNITRQK